MNAQDQRETSLMNMFLELYSDNNIKILSKGESPDFMAEVDGKRIGIELTEVFQDSDTGQSRLQQSSSANARFTDDLVTLVQPHISFTFLIGIGFNNDFPIKKSARKELLERLKHICVSRMQSLSNFEHLYLENYDDNLPEEIDDIDIDRYDGMEESFNSKPEGGIVGNLRVEHLRPILTKKDLKITKYEKCDSYWLIIREGNYYAGSFDKIEIKIPIESRFDRVLLVRTGKREVVILK